MALYDLFSATQSDEWRLMVGFSQDIAAYNHLLFDASLSTSAAELILNDWLRSRSHPCVPGRVAAIRRRHTFCILTGKDLLRGDEYIISEIQRHRTRWKHAARDGKTSSFIVAVISKALAIASPNESLKQFVLGLCKLILGRSALDDILHDDLDLLIGSRVVRWRAGVSLFAAQGDKRWWHDHRFPGGIAFSLNSIGHVAAVRALEMHGGDFESKRLRNLHDWSLKLAMHTINDASRRRYRCTWLLPQSEKEALDSLVKLGGNLKGFSAQQYGGVYHTDYTVPSEFFDDTMCAPRGTYKLSLSYLHDPTDPEYEVISLGQPTNLRGAF